MEAVPGAGKLIIFLLIATGTSLFLPQTCAS